MSDLISRSALIEVLEKYKFGAISNDSEREYIKETVLNFVNKQPTAYNVDKVLEQINEDLDTYFDGGDFATCHDRLVVLKDVNKIVKEGGVE